MWYVLLIFIRGEPFRASTFMTFHLYKYGERLEGPLARENLCERKQQDENTQSCRYPNPCAVTKTNQFFFYALDPTVSGIFLEAHRDHHGGKER